MNTIILSICGIISIFGLILCILLLTGPSNLLNNMSSPMIGNSNNVNVTMMPTVPSVPVITYYPSSSPTSSPTSAPTITSYNDYLQMLKTNPHLLTQTEWNNVESDPEITSCAKKGISYSDYENIWNSKTYPPDNGAMIKEHFPLSLTMIKR